MKTRDGEQGASAPCLNSYLEIENVITKIASFPIRLGSYC
jgi:hypothetical protein